MGCVRPCITPHPLKKQTKGDNEVRENLCRTKTPKMRFEDAPISVMQKSYGGKGQKGNQNYD
jgi:hypothetical protein